MSNTRIEVSKKNTFKLEELESVRSAEFVDHLRTTGYAFMEVPGLGGQYKKSRDVSKAFFSLSEDCKKKAMLQSNDFQGVIQGDFNGKELSKSTYKVVLRERGWVSSALVNSKMQKEYFQYGHEPKSSEDAAKLIPNAWIEEGILDKFQETKLEILEIYDKVHLSIFKCISDTLNLSNMVVWPRNILVRDTFYFPTQEETRNAEHVDLGEITLIHLESGFELLIDEVWYSFDCSKVSKDLILCISGLALEIRTNGLIKAAKHRVVTPDEEECGKPRYSCVSFGNTGVDDLLDPEFNGTGVKGSYLPIRRNLLPLVGNKNYIKEIGDSCA